MLAIIMQPTAEPHHSFPISLILTFALFFHLFFKSRASTYEICLLKNFILNLWYLQFFFSLCSHKNLDFCFLLLIIINYFDLFYAYFHLLSSLCLFLPPFDDCLIFSFSLQFTYNYLQLSSHQYQDSFFDFSFLHLYISVKSIAFYSHPLLAYALIKLPSKTLQVFFAFNHFVFFSVIVVF